MSEVSATITVQHVSGMHARASTKFVEVAQQFKSAVHVSRDGIHEVDGKSILGCLTLGVEIGHQIHIRVSGPDAEGCLSALIDLVERNFDGA
ncbi:MAG: HPr family phosphocarrier protein [Planctomycetes bacterium]|nr:HPr family phosphocarrier protein [Planctomycetota bacterium]